jgi:hypothetical protein
MYTQEISDNGHLIDDPQIFKRRYSTWENT